MTINLLLHTLSTTTPVTGDCIVYWQNAPKLAPSVPSSSPNKALPPPKLIDATPLTLDQVWPLVAPYRRITLLGMDLLLPLKQATAHQLINFTRSLAQANTDDGRGGRQVTAILNSDDALRGQNELEVLLRTLTHSAERITALRDLPSGRDREFAGMVRFTRGTSCRPSSSSSSTPSLRSMDFVEGERLYRYRENMMDATLHT